MVTDHIVNHTEKHEMKSQCGLMWVQVLRRGSNIVNGLANP